MIIIGDNLLPIATEISSTLNNRALVTGFFAIIIVFPLCLLPKVKYLSFTSFLAMVFILYLSIIIIWRGSQRVDAGDVFNSDDFKWTHLQTELLTGIPLITFAFAYNTTMFPIFAEMDNPTPKRCRTVISIALGISTVAYFLVGIFGYFTFLELTKGNILNNYVNDTFAEIGKIGLAGVIIFSYPILHYPMRFSILISIEPLIKQKHYYYYYVGLTVLIIISSYLIAIAYPDISFVFSIAGATVGNFIIFILPAAIYIKLIEGKMYSYDKIVAWILLLLGIGLGIGCTTIVILQEFCPDCL